MPFPGLPAAATAGTAISRPGGQRPLSCPGAPGRTVLGPPIPAVKPSGRPPTQTRHRPRWTRPGGIGANSGTVTQAMVGLWPRVGFEVARSAGLHCGSSLAAAPTRGPSSGGTAGAPACRGFDRVCGSARLKASDFGLPARRHWAGSSARYTWLMVRSRAQICALVGRQDGLRAPGPNLPPARRAPPPSSANARIEFGDADVVELGSIVRPKVTVMLLPLVTQACGMAHMYFSVQYQL